MSKKKPKLYKCKSYGKETDNRNGFYRNCFDRLLTEDDLTFKIVSDTAGVGHLKKVYKCKYCRENIEEVTIEEEK